MKGVNMKTVQIRCPECQSIQAATIKQTAPFLTYLHDCTNCGYVIMESEWDEVKGGEK